MWYYLLFKDLWFSLPVTIFILGAGVNTSSGDAWNMETLGASPTKGWGRLGTNLGVGGAGRRMKTRFVAAFQQVLALLWFRDILKTRWDPPRVKIRGFTLHTIYCQQSSLAFQPLLAFFYHPAPTLWFYRKIPPPTIRDMRKHILQNSLNIVL